MSAHVVVIATDLRRTTIKVSPGTYLVDVLGEACKKLKLPGDKYLLKHKQKHVDLSIPFRTSGLIPGAKLELVQKANTPSAVQIALQIPQPEAKEIAGGRLIRKFPSDLALWTVLRQFESGAGKNINITARAVAVTNGSGSGQLYYETPVLNVMGRELSTFDDFQKTLSQLGHNSGNVLIRLAFRKTDQTLPEAIDYINHFFREAQAQDTATAKIEEEKEEKNTSDAAPEPESSPSQVKHPPEFEAEKHPDNSDTMPPSVPSNPLPESRYQPVNVFLAPETGVPAAARAPAEDDADFTPTIAHAQLHQALLQKSARNKRLLSDKEIEDKEAAEQARIASVKSMLVKVRFPDNTSSDWLVGPDDTGAFLYQAVRHVMAHCEQPFRLLLPGGGAVIRDDDSSNNRLIKAYKLSGRVLITLVWDHAVPANVRSQPFLQSQIAQHGLQIKVSEIPTTPSLEETGDTVTLQLPKTSRSEGVVDGSSKKTPKWFKFGKK